MTPTIKVTHQKSRSWISIRNRSTVDNIANKQTAACGSRFQTADIDISRAITRRECIRSHLHVFTYNACLVLL